ncbi:MAG: cyclase family protein [Arcobacteraceae bacterium]|jgi:kynurenine formamidase|nr:cyclase family protein [Arcobacteraceae bacterium]
MKKIWLSHIIDENTPLYGGRVENLSIYKTSSIDEGKIANDTRIETTVHVGTHIDMPYHFHQNGQTIEDYDINFWFFSKPLIIDFKPEHYIIEDDLTSILEEIEDIGFDILIVKTGLCHIRTERTFWEYNYGFSPAIYDYLVKNFSKIRVVGFDSISISSWQNRDLGKTSHKVFLNPTQPILILEDMDLRAINKDTKLEKITIMPMRLSQCDGLPCTVFGEIDE